MNKAQPRKLFPDENHNGDGRHVAYLEDSGQCRGYDPALFDILKQIVDRDERKVSAVERG